MSILGARLKGSDLWNSSKGILSCISKSNIQHYEGKCWRAMRDMSQKSIHIHREARFSFALRWPLSHRMPCVETNNRLSASPWFEIEMVYETTAKRHQWWCSHSINQSKYFLSSQSVSDTIELFDGSNRCTRRLWNVSCLFLASRGTGVLDWSMAARQNREKHTSLHLGRRMKLTTQQREPSDLHEIKQLEFEPKLREEFPDASDCK